MFNSSSTGLFHDLKAQMMNDSSILLAGEAIPGDASVISNWLPQARCDLAEYTREVDRLRSRLIKLEGVRDSLQQRIDRHSALFAPVIRLPTEVLHMIFCLSCIPDDSEGPHHRERNVSLMYPAGRTALRLSLVCSRWRSVALGIPEIWSYINVSILSHCELGSILTLAKESNPQLPAYEELPRCIEAHSILDIVKLYLELSLNHPLTIHLYCPSDLGYAPRLYELSPTESVCNYLLLEVFHSLCYESSRWRTVYVNLAHGPQSPPVDADGTIHDPDEEILYDQSDNWDFVDDMTAPLLEVLDLYLGHARINLLETPRLHTLRLTATPWGQSLLDKGIFKAPSLRSLTLRKYEASYLYRILPDLVNQSGVNVFFERPHQVEYSDHMARDFQAPAVKSISVQDNGLSRSLKNLLTRLTIPNTSKMEFVCNKMDHASSFPHQLLVGMIQRSVMPLKVLKFGGFYMPSEALVEILKLLPTIEVLEVTEGSFPQLKYEVQNLEFLSEELKVKGADSGGSQWSLAVDEYTAWQVEKSFICSNLIRKLTLPSNASSHLDFTPLLPNLSSLKLCFRPTCDSQDLKNMVYSRRRDLELASNTLQSGSSSEVVVLNSNTDSIRSAGGLRSLRLIDLVLIMDTLTLGGRATSTLKEFENVIKELKDEGLDAKISSIEYL